jgi:hypothetical protein
MIYNPFRPTEQEQATKTRGKVTTASLNQNTIKAPKNARARVCVYIHGGHSSAMVPVVQITKHVNGPNLDKSP